MNIIQIHNECIRIAAKIKGCEVIFGTSLINQEPFFVSFRVAGAITVHRKAFWGDDPVELLRQASDYADAYPAMMRALAEEKLRAAQAEVNALNCDA